MSLRSQTTKGGTTRSTTESEEHYYGFSSLVNRKKALSGIPQLQKRICYCTDSTVCTPDRLMDIGQLTINGVLFAERLTIISTPWSSIMTVNFQLTCWKCDCHAFCVCADVWNGELLVVTLSRVSVPFNVKSPLNQQDSQRKLVVTRGDVSLPCKIENSDSCSFSFKDFAKDTWESRDAATLEYYDSSLPKDVVDSRPVPYVAIAYLIPSGA